MLGKMLTSNSVGIVRTALTQEKHAAFRAKRNRQEPVKGILTVKLEPERSS